MTTVIETLTTLGLPAQNLSLEQSLQALNSLTSNGARQVNVRFCVSL